MALVKISAVGPIYWATERFADGSALSLPWMREVEPPYRYGRAVRIKIRRSALQLGICRRTDHNDLRRDLDIPPGEIREWR